MPGPMVAARWYGDAHTRFGPPAVLTISRLPFIATAVLGCLALFGCGVLIGGRWVGAIAALLLMINPLFRLHAHRAMSDVPCESFMIAALGLALWGATRIWSGRGIGSGLVLFAAAGVCAGLSIVCKLNGLLAPMIIVAWSGLAMLVSRLDVRAKGGIRRRGGPLDRDDVDDRPRAQPDADLPARKATSGPRVPSWRRWVPGAASGRW